MPDEKGLIHVYYGDGQGKTSAAFGLAFRCAGRGGLVVIARFMKGGESGEVMAARDFQNIKLLDMGGAEKFTIHMSKEEKADAARRCGLLFIDGVETAQDLGARMLVLDEVLAACEHELLNPNMVTRFLDAKPPGLELVLTGHSLVDSIRMRAHYITRMEKIRHPFDQGIPARMGIEY